MTCIVWLNKLTIYFTLFLLLDLYPVKNAYSSLSMRHWCLIKCIFIAFAVESPLLSVHTYTYIPAKYIIIVYRRSQALLPFIWEPAKVRDNCSDKWEPDLYFRVKRVTVRPCYTIRARVIYKGHVRADTHVSCILEYNKTLSVIAGTTIIYLFQKAERIENGSKAVGKKAFSAI